MTDILTHKVHWLIPGGGEVRGQNMDHKSTECTISIKEQDLKVTFQLKH